MPGREMYLRKSDACSILRITTVDRSWGRMMGFTQEATSIMTASDRDELAQYFVNEFVRKSWNISAPDIELEAIGAIPPLEKKGTFKKALKAGGASRTQLSGNIPKGVIRSARFSADMTDLQPRGNCLSTDMWRLIIL
jgi:hypothetical protein